MAALTNNAKKALTASETKEVFLFTLRLFVDGAPVLSCVNNTQPVVSQGVTFEAVGFSLTLPEQNDDSGSKTCKLSIDNVDLQIMKTITNAIGKTITAVISVILASAPDVIERGPITMILRNVTANKSTVSGDLYDMYLYDRNIPEGRYTPKDFPGLFAPGYT